MIKKDILSQEQDIAAEPTKNIWVQANAGTGKTSVLTARLMRILFRSKNLDDGILCLTYTNAAAGEMKNRILMALRGWAMATDEELSELLIGITKNTTPSDKDILHARKIFFKYIDNPDMLKIKTIHGFCEEILRRFPQEAGIAPSWTLISDAPQRVLLHDALEQLVNTKSDDERVTDAFEHIVGVMSEYRLDGLLENIGQQYKYFFGIDDIDKYRDYFIDKIKKILNLDIPKKTDFSSEKLLEIVECIKSDKKAGKRLLNVVNLIEQYIDNTIDFEKYKNGYLTSDGNVRQGLNKDYLLDEIQRVSNQNSININSKIFADTIAMFDLSAAFAKKYKEIKKSLNVLDFEDLILYTHHLFSNPETMGWVLSQLDLSLTHILVDEAQDTGPMQWELLQMLSGDFFTDGDTDETPHSMFVVGDTKQSIYGFQGADPGAFARSRQEIASYIKNSARQIQEIPLTQSFRSVAPILKTVDMFFGNKNVATRTGFINNPHKCFRIGDKGCVEIHNLVTPGEEKTSVVRRKYIRDIAQEIENLLKSGKYQPNDIMVLVQNRHPFAPALANELRRRGIDTAGSDRIILPEYPVIMDLMNLLRFCMDTTDDYSLCCVLKSPLFALNDNAVYKICAARNAENTTRHRTNTDATLATVFEFVQTMHPNIFAILSEFMNIYKKSGPYTFFTHVLNHHDMRSKMISALGTQIIEPLEEFLTICLAYERTRPGTLRHFIKWFITGASEVKRDMDSNAGVRIVTVHGSKGLQSKVVFLIDTTSMPRSSNIYNIKTEGTEKYPVWIWCEKLNGSQSSEIEQIKSNAHWLDIQESFRLLYVAMTRARDELHIYGFSRTKNAPDLSWHKMLWETLSEHPEITVQNDTIRISNE